jgi:hypothetical protein
VQSVPACQVRQDDPVATGLQTSTRPPLVAQRAASRVSQAFATGQAQAVPPAASTQEVPGSPHAAEAASYQQPLPELSWAHVTTSPAPLQKLEVAALQRVVAHAQEAEDPVG